MGHGTGGAGRLRPGARQYRASRVARRSGAPPPPAFTDPPSRSRRPRFFRRQRATRGTAADSARTSRSRSRCPRRGRDRSDARAEGDIPACARCMGRGGGDETSSTALTRSAAQPPDDGRARRAPAVVAKSGCAAMPGRGSGCSVVGSAPASERGRRSTCPPAARQVRAQLAPKGARACGRSRCERIGHARSE